MDMFEKVQDGDIDEDVDFQSFLKAVARKLQSAHEKINDLEGTVEAQKDIIDHQGQIIDELTVNMTKSIQDAVDDLRGDLEFRIENLESDIEDNANDIYSLQNILDL